MKSKPPAAERLRSSRRVWKMLSVLSARCCTPGPRFCSRYVCGRSNQNPSQHDRLEQVAIEATPAAAPAVAMHALRQSIARSPADRFILQCCMCTCTFCPGSCNVIATSGSTQVWDTCPILAGGLCGDQLLLTVRVLCWPAKLRVRAGPHLDLGLAPRAKGGLVDGQQHHLVVAGQHHAVQARVHRAHILQLPLPHSVTTHVASWA